MRRQLLRRPRRVELPEPPPSYHEAMEKLKAKAERQMATFDELPAGLRDVVNGVGDRSASIAFYNRGVRGTKAAEDFRAKIGLQRAEGEVDSRSTQEQVLAALERANEPRRAPTPTVDPGTARDRAMAVLAAARRGS